MLPFKKILTTTDFSEPSYYGLDTANEIAMNFQAELCVVHVISLTTFSEGANFDITAYQEALEEDARKQISKLIAERISPDIIKCSPIVVSGSAADEIMRIAKEENYDLIVIATHGRGLRRFVFGSVAEKVVRLADCPVLTIRPKQD